ncbi:MAG: small subunit ribosomal protein S21 [Parvicella sp.]|jgi:small subunit ribosomal protein S21
MLVIPVKEGESIERALKKYKKKFDRTKVVRQLRKRQQFDKPSRIRRAEVIKAKYVQRMKEAEN